MLIAFAFDYWSPTTMVHHGETWLSNRLHVDRCLADAIW